jgi:sugar O-acyltransferase (sialic acid O-acetyltransferase NeuD family)
MPSIAIFGGPGSGAIAADSVTASNAGSEHTRLLGFLNDALPPGSSVSGAPVLGPFASWRDLPEDTLFLAPLHRAKAMEERLRIVEKLGIPANRWATIIDPRSAVAADAELGYGCFIGPFATVGPATSIGPHTVVRSGAHVSHDCGLGTFVFVGINAVISGFGSVGDGAFVGPGAIVREHRRLGRFAVVGAGSVVRKDVQENEVVSGLAARRVGAPMAAPPEEDID